MTPPSLTFVFQCLPWVSLTFPIVLCFDIGTSTEPTNYVLPLLVFWRKTQQKRSWKQQLWLASDRAIGRVLWVGFLILVTAGFFWTWTQDPSLNDHLCHTYLGYHWHHISRYLRVVNLHPRSLTVRPGKWMVGRLFFFWDASFSGAMLNFRGVSQSRAKCSSSAALWVFGSTGYRVPIWDLSTGTPPRNTILRFACSVVGNNNIEEKYSPDVGCWFS